MATNALRFLAIDPIILDVECVDVIGALAHADLASDTSILVSLDDKLGSQ
jgi:hypothetical protein